MLQFKVVDQPTLDLLIKVKIDIVNYPYDWIDKPIIAHKIKLASAKEIAAMKIAAIINRVTKKDFIDLNELLKIFSIQQIFEFYLKKFIDSSLFIV